MFEINLIRQGRTEEYKLICPYDEILVGNIKTIPVEQRKFSPVEKTFSLKAVGLYTLMKKYKGDASILFKFEDDKQKVQFLNIIAKHKNKIQAKIDAKNKIEENTKRILEIKANLPELIKNFDYTSYLKEGIIPYDHQVAGAYLTNELNHNILIAAGLGSGKSAMGLIACEMNNNIKKVLIVCPNSLKLNWKNEIDKFIKNQKSYVLAWSKGKVLPHVRNKYEMNDCKYIIVHYDYFRDSSFPIDEKVKKLGLADVSCIIYDESHKLAYKNNTTHNIKNAFKHIQKNILLTGTPIKSKVQSLYKLLNKISPVEFSNENKFYTEFCGLRYDPYNYGWVEDKKNPAKFDDLHKKIQHLMYRVVTADVIKNLPPQVIHRVVLELSDKDRKTYIDVESGFSKVNWEKRGVIKTGDDESDSPIVILNRLRQLTAKYKIDYVHNFIKELNDEGEKVVVFDCYKESLKSLKQTLGDSSEVYTGDTSIDKRQELVDEFQDPNSRLKNLLISMNAGNAGITLTSASNLVLITQSYLSDENLQAFARINRISQTKISNVFILLIEDTIDEIIYEKVQKQVEMIDRVIDGKISTDTSKTTALGDILSELKTKYNK